MSMLICCTRSTVIQPISVSGPRIITATSMSTTTVAKTRGQCHRSVSVIICPRTSTKIVNAPSSPLTNAHSSPTISAPSPKMSVTSEYFQYFSFVDIDSSF